MTDLKSFVSLAGSINAVASPFRSYLNDLYIKHRGLKKGKVADYIPELALASSDSFGICVVSTDGQT
ncbi:MAG: hypothetical protein WBM08_05875, partial [Prochlorococcaceae cyanobacterium]